MSGNGRQPDPIDAAIAAAPAAPDALVAQATLKKGGVIRIIVPIEFGPDEFESAVGLLMHLRVEADRRAEAARRGGLVLPDGR